MNFYKEIFLDFESNCKINPQVYNLFSVDNNNKRQARNDNITRRISKKGSTFAFDVFIVQWYFKKFQFNKKFQII